MPSPVDGARLGWAMEKLARAFPASFGPTSPGEPPDRAAGTVTLWRELLDQHPWITDGVFVGGVYEMCWRHDQPFLPGPALALDYFREAERKIEAAEAQAELGRLEQRAARREPPTGDPETTAEERERWAREDAFIRRYVPGVLREWERSSYLDDWGPHPTKPGVWIRTEPEGMARLAESRRRDEALARVPDLTPEQRRARDRRLEAEKAAAQEFIRNLRPRSAPTGWASAAPRGGGEEGDGPAPNP